MTTLGITPQGTRALRDYFDAAILYGPSKRKIYDAVVLTAAQLGATESALRSYWHRSDYVCPTRLSLKPLHGYESRVLRDGFAAAQYRAWLELGCSDASVVSTDAAGRPCLFVAGIVDALGTTYDLVVPIRSDARGHVWIDDVIPKGLWRSRG